MKKSVYSLFIFLLFSSCLVDDDSFGPKAFRHTVDLQLESVEVQDGRSEGVPDFYYTGIKVTQGSSSPATIVSYGGFDEPLSFFELDLVPNQSYRIQIACLAKGIDSYGIEVSSTVEAWESRWNGRIIDGGYGIIIPLYNEMITDMSIDQPKTEVNLGDFSGLKLINNVDSTDIREGWNARLYYQDILFSSNDPVSTLEPKLQYNGIRINAKNVPAEYYLEINSYKGFESTFGGPRIRIENDTSFVNYFTSPYLDGTTGVLRIELMRKSDNQLHAELFSNNLSYERLELKTILIDLENYNTSDSNDGITLLLEDSNLFEGDTIRIGG